MSTPNFSINIDAEDVMRQLEEEQERRSKMSQSTQQREYNPKRYLNFGLTKQEESKQIIIRLLPFSKEGGSPFHKVNMHTIRVSPEVAQSGWKTITCSCKNPEASAQPTPCPFCETSKAAKQMAKSTINQAEKKRYEEISYMNSSNEMWIARCIERGAEEDGVKFWLFSKPKNGGIYQTIMNIYKTRMEAAKRRGEVRNIFDLNNGKDLIITIKRGADGKKKVDIVDDDAFTPLTNNIEQGVAWINDETKWFDLYPIKRSDYCAILVEGGVPYWDKEQKCFVDKETYQHNAMVKKEEKKIAQEEKATKAPIDYSAPLPLEAGSGIGITTNQTQEVAQPYRGPQPQAQPLGGYNGPTPQPIQTNNPSQQVNQGNAFTTNVEVPPMPDGWAEDIPF